MVKADPNTIASQSALPPASTALPSHRVSLFAGTKGALRAFAELVPAARAYALTPGASLFALPLLDEVHEGLHRANGTGEWIDFGDVPDGPLLTSTDMVFAARASAGTALGWIATNYGGGEGWQAAAVWIDGVIALKPVLLGTVEQRPQSLVPVNTALRMLGVPVLAGVAGEEAGAFGLWRYPNNEAVASLGFVVGL